MSQVAENQSAALTQNPQNFYFIKTSTWIGYSPV